MPELIRLCEKNVSAQTANFDVVYQSHIIIDEITGILVIFDNFSTIIPFAQ